MTTLEEIGISDKSWERAQELVSKHLSSASLISRLVRNGWMGAVDEKEFVKLFTFSRLSPNCLLDAARSPSNEESDNKIFSLEKLTHAVQTLGVPLASAIVGINFSCSAILARNSIQLSHNQLWKNVYSELMTLIELGYRFGSRVRELGPAAGCLAGFGVGCGMLIVLSENPEYLQKWLLESPPKLSSLQQLGVEISQLSGFVLQNLGFGHESAFGAAFGSGPKSEAPLEFSPDCLIWIASCRWIEALRYSRNYPRDLALRSTFHSITPPLLGSGLRNASLEALYADVAGVVREGSKWTWHLPKGTYEEI